MKSRLWNRSKTISEILQANAVHFLCMKTTQYNKIQDKLHSSRNNVALFSQLFSSCETSEGVFRHEKQTALPSLFIRT